MSSIACFPLLLLPDPPFGKDLYHLPPIRENEDFPCPSAMSVFASFRFSHGLLVSVLTTTTSLFSPW